MPAMANRSWMLTPLLWNWTKVRKEGNGRGVWGEWRHLVAAARGVRKAHAPMYGAGSAAVSLGSCVWALAVLLEWPCTAGAEDCASEYAFDHLGAQSQISHTVNETIPKNPEVGDYILKCSCR